MFLPWLPKKYLLALKPNNKDVLLSIVERWYSMGPLHFHTSYKESHSLPFALDYRFKDVCMVNSLRR